MATDSTLQKDILEELSWEPSVDAAHIGVSVKDGLVTLSGHVSSFAEKFGAEKAVKRVRGVRAVADELDVKLAGSSMRTDEDIAAACLNAFKYNYAVPNEQVRLIVNSGWLTLEGEVEWQYQKNAAESAVRYQIGVTGVTNDIVVKTPASPSEIKGQIEAAFKRSAEVDAQRVSVETHDGIVILHGTVRSWAEWKEAQRAAWAAPGVTRVDNEISVSP